MITAIKNILLLSAVAISTVVSGQDNDPKAKKVLDELSKKTQAFSTITASFTSTLENKQAGMEVTQEGTIKLKGTKFNLVLDDYLILSDGYATWTVAAADNEVYIDDA